MVKRSDGQVVRWSGTYFDCFRANCSKKLLEPKNESLCLFLCLFVHFYSQTCVFVVWIMFLGTFLKLITADSWWVCPVLMPVTACRRL